jgi:hypothetical protein
MFKRILCAIPAMLVISAVSANACSPMPPPPPPPPPFPGESAEAYKSRSDAYYLEIRHKEEVAAANRAGIAEGYETGLWETAGIVAVVEIVAKDGDGYFAPSEGGPETTLKVVNAIRGNPLRKPFKIGYEGMTSCGPYGHVNLVGGNIGDRFVIFAKSRKLTQESIIIGYSKSEARTYRSKQLLQVPKPAGE